MKLKLGHHENLTTLPLEPSAHRASNLACFKDKRLSSLSQLQMVIAAVVLRGSTPRPSRQITLIWLKVMKLATPYMVVVGSFAMFVCVTAKHRPPLLTAAGQGQNGLQWHGNEVEGQEFNHPRIGILCFISDL